MSKDRYDRGLEKLRQIHGKPGELVIKDIEAFSPDLARYILEFPFGDIYSRPGLDLKSREIGTVAALTALGNAEPQLRSHIQGALNVGCSRQEIIELILQMAVYAGFPVALRAMNTAKTVFQELDR